MRVNNPQSERPCQTLLPGGLLVSSGLPGGIQNRAEADAIKEATDRKLDFQGDRIRAGLRGGGRVKTESDTCSPPNPQARLTGQRRWPVPARWCSRQRDGRASRRGNGAAQ